MTLNYIKLKIQAVLVVLTLLFCISVGSVAASDGRIVLKSGNVSCEGISIWQGSSYQVAGKCFGLVYPYDEQLDTYVLWVRLENGDTDRVTEIDEGIFDRSVNDKFNSLFVTVETNGSPRQPGKIIMAGDIQKFPESEDTNETISTPEPKANTGFFATPSATKVDPISIGKKVTTAAITGILLILGIMVALFFIMRKK